MVDLRRATEADVESGARCHVECWREAYAELVDPDRLAAIVAEIAERVELWQLLPLLVHAVLFGGSYGASAGRAAERYL